MYKNDNSHIFCFPFITTFSLFFFFPVYNSLAVSMILMILNSIIEENKALSHTRMTTLRLFVFGCLLFYNFFCLFSVYISVAD